MLVPTTVPGLTDVISIVGGNRHACALLRSGRVMCWGDDSVGQLGDGRLVLSETAVTVRMP